RSRCCSTRYGSYWSRCRSPCLTLCLPFDGLSLLEAHDLDRRLPHLSKDHLDGLAEVVGVVRVRERFPQYLQRGCLSEQPVGRLIGFVRVLAFDRRPVQPVPGGQVFLVFVGDLLSGLLRDVGTERRVERLEDGRGALGVRGGKRATPVGDGEQDEISELPRRDVELELVEGL